MSPILKNALALIAGIVVGSIVNMALVMLGPLLIPPPAGAEVTSTEGLKASMHLFGPQHFIFPFLAHALGTFFGAYLCAKLAASHKNRLADAIGIFFMIGGISSVLMLPSPLWFSLLDLLVAYLPMAYFGRKLATT